MSAAMTASAAAISTLSDFPRNKTTAAGSIVAPVSVSPDRIPLLPPATTLTFVAEGAANILFRCTPSPTATPSLLRLRKTLASSQPNLDAFRYLSATAFPLFPPKLLVATSLIRLPPGLVTATNKMIHAMEARGERNPKRVGLYLEESETHGLLVADMTPRGAHEVLVEFKPKWVVQSASAPKGWTKCRTCALRAMKAAQKGKDISNYTGFFCPLDLASGDKSRVARAVNRIIPPNPPSVWPADEKDSWLLRRTELVATVTKYLLNSQLIPVIKQLHMELDPVGPLKSSMDKAFLDAMTVRDLTIFLRVSADTGEIECGIGDLDLKTGEGGKRLYWRDTERRLVEEGWYMGVGMDEGRCGV